MKRLDQSVIDAAQRCADDRVAQSPRILTKRGAAEYMPERIAWEAMNAIGLSGWKR